MIKMISCQHGVKMSNVNVTVHCPQKRVWPLWRSAEFTTY